MSPSDYDISIDPRTASNFDIDFDCNKTETLLSKINVNKEIGPNVICGQVLENCAKSLSALLSLLYRKTYYSG